MVTLVGILCLIFICSSILILTPLATSSYQKRSYMEGTKDNYSYLFDVYDETFFLFEKSCLKEQC